MDVTDGVATVLVDNHPVNAMGRAVLEGLLEAAHHIRAQGTSVRAVVLTGAGTKAFMAGADITEFDMLRSRPDGVEKHSAFARMVFDAWSNLEQPLVAAVQASAVGGGLEIALVCDVIVADPAAVLGLPEVKLGLIPGGGGTQRLPGRIGVPAATELMLLGTVVTAERALHLGLVNRVAAPGCATDESYEIAERIAALPWVAVRNIKRAIGVYSRVDPRQLDQERTLFTEAFGSADMDEGMAAFLEKRRPSFTHR
ncbi:enoyl-CoA hydratase/isomerase family protein [Gordonia rubripertincta]|uniref:Enoyl-CoA hydratase-related protein n=1 Tax=Gordonia rubripertincta TaxID=36822 RepID=A0ABT4MWP1_GORRU|nr:enoyl-CoA hydratase-related protein [Gordonia rubripertincta]MCZ4551434.1 enoyl-CoA hydratase-related protein [Gordonia rubripertincta]